MAQNEACRFKVSNFGSVTVRRLLGGSCSAVETPQGQKLQREEEEEGEEEEAAYKAAALHMWSQRNRIHAQLRFLCGLFLISQKMDFKLWISALCVTLCAALCAPAAETRSAAPASAQRHVRYKRCSCATFLDKECVYFCHLDIIWVNTPERVVSYGLGNAPRAKRDLSVSTATSRAPRCRCLHGNDNSCVNFCLRSEMATGARMRSPGHARTEDTGEPDRSEGASAAGRVQPAVFGAVRRIRLMLEKWPARRHHRARAWQGDSAAS
ncbi:endothelin-1 [Poecilia latipinna]|nr:PREDICTED: endothelin-1 [Poecilia formosa]XP_014887041.1 PREDICTED: endothelin-2-like [Poecilia latipinna]